MTASFSASHICNYGAIDEAAIVPLAFSETQGYVTGISGWLYYPASVQRQFQYKLDAVSTGSNRNNQVIEFTVVHKSFPRIFIQHHGSK